MAPTAAAGDLKDLKNDLKSLAASSSSSSAIRASELARDFREFNGIAFPHRKFGCSSFEDFIKRECRDIFEFDPDVRDFALRPIIVHSNKITQLISRQRNPTSRARPNRFRQPVRPARPHQPYRPRLPARPSYRHQHDDRDEELYEHPEPPNLRTKTIENLRRLVDRGGGAVELNKVMGDYLKEFDECLQYERLGHPSLLSFCSTLSNVFSLQRKKDAQNWTLHTKSKSDPYIMIKDEEPETPQPSAPQKKSSQRRKSSSSSDDDALPFIEPVQPPTVDFVTDGNIIPKPPSLTLSYHEGYIAEVLDPSHFWFHIQSEDHGMALEILMSEMSVQYSKCPTNYVMPKETVQPGQLCIAPCFEVPHRAIILEERRHKSVKVRFIDYGTIKNVLVKDIKYLLKEFAQLPAQAFRGRLAHCYPINGDLWTKEATDLFLNSVLNKKLYIKLLNYEENDGVYWTKLVDVSLQNKDVYISQLIADEKLGLVIKETIPNHVCMKPSFEEIENGHCVPLVSKNSPSDINIIDLSSDCDNEKKSDDFIESSMKNLNNSHKPDVNKLNKCELKYEKNFNTIPVASKKSNSKNSIELSVRQDDKNLNNFHKPNVKKQNKFDSKYEKYFNNAISATSKKHKSKSANLKGSNSPSEGFEELSISTKKYTTATLLAIESNHDRKLEIWKVKIPENDTPKVMVMVEQMVHTFASEKPEKLIEIFYDLTRTMDDIRIVDMMNYSLQIEKNLERNGLTGILVGKEMDIGVFKHDFESHSKKYLMVPLDCLLVIFLQSKASLKTSSRDFSLFLMRLDYMYNKST